MILGIDFSLSSPSFTLIGEHCIQVTCVSNYVRHNQHVIVTSNSNQTFQFSLEAMPKVFDCDQVRIDYLLNQTMRFVDSSTMVALEGYSFSSKGRVFSIAEATGVIKYHLWKMNKPVSIYSPSTVKKWATGKGNANKEQMIEAFQSQTGLNLPELFKINKRSRTSSPISDIVDSYFIASMGYNSTK